MRFFQTCGLPADDVESIYYDEIDHDLVRTAAQWRLDYPLPVSAHLDASTEQILSVAETLLTRGTTPFCSPDIDRALSEKIPQSEDASVLDRLRDLANGSGSCPIDAPYGSDEERQFADILATWAEVEAGGWHIIPQVHLAALSLEADPAAQERVDFVLFRLGQRPIVVEIDGIDHLEHRDRDESRDALLRAAGFMVHRIAAEEVRSRQGPGLSALHSTISVRPETVPSKASHRIRAAKLVHQIQLALLEATRGGWIRVDEPWKVFVALPTKLEGVPGIEDMVSLAGSQFVELLAQIRALHGAVEISPIAQSTTSHNESGGDFDLLILARERAPGDDGLSTGPMFQISDTALPVEIMSASTPSAPATIESPPREVAQWFLQFLFRKDDFLEGQWEAIERTLNGEDSVVLLPTGGGKSLVFQLAALLLPGRCLVVEPTVALMADQVDNLSKVGIDRCVEISSRIRSFVERNRVMRTFAAGHYLFSYVAPERLQMVDFREALTELTVGTPVSVIVVDEAHCVSEWGHDFRTAYLNLGRISREYCASATVVPPLVALTGTASRIVLKDVQRELGIASFDAIITPESFDRIELEYSILHSRSDEKAPRVQGFLTRLPASFGVSSGTFFDPARGSENFSGLLFCPHVNGEFGVVQQATQIGSGLGLDVEIYSGGAPRGYNRDGWDSRKQEVERRFKRNRTNLMACTSAFGMGIDKPNIRYTVHTALPPSIEAFYQEAGRAGRDRMKAHCAVVVSNDDPGRSAHLLAPTTPIEEVARVVENTDRYDADDILRTLFFHVRSFRGRVSDTQDLSQTIRRLGDLSQRRHVPPLSWRQQSGDQSDNGSKEQMEKALHRLVVLGVVDDYTVDYGSREFVVRLSGASQDDIIETYVRYVSAYNARLGERHRIAALTLRRSDHSGFVQSIGNLLIDFVYEHLELGRRRAIAEMLEATNIAADGESLRRRILAYLERSEFDDRLEDVIGSTDGGLDEIANFIDEIASPNHAAALRGAVARFLESYPDVPGLLLLRALAESLSSDGDPDVVAENVRAALGFSSDQFGLDQELVGRAIAEIAAGSARRPGAGEQILLTAFAHDSVDRRFGRSVLGHGSPNVAIISASWLNRQLTSRVTAMLS